MSKSEREALSHQFCQDLGKEHPDDPTPPPKRCVMRCGHEDTVSAGIDPIQQDCWTCQRTDDPTIQAREAFRKRMNLPELTRFRSWLTKLRGDRLHTLYLDKIHQCGFDRNEIATPKRMQELVQVWREIWRRRLAGR